jgi:cytochrome c biogenesis protein CcmG/thiol:disulfide interchange protein DsbE
VTDIAQPPDGAVDRDEVPGAASGGTGPGDAGGDRGPTGRARVGLVVSGVVAVLALAFVAVLATREPATERRSTSPLIGRAAPALVGETLDGGTFDIDDHRGRWVVVNFFATWCPPCVEEHPELVSFDEAHRAAGDAALVSVVFRNDPDEVRAFFAARGGEWPVVDDGGQAAVAYGVVAVPETYLVTPSGIVVQKYTGGVTRAAIEADIAAADPGEARDGEAGG